MRLASLYNQNELCRTAITVFYLNISHEWFSKHRYKNFSIYVRNRIDYLCRNCRVERLWNFIGYSQLCDLGVGSPDAGNWHYRRDNQPGRINVGLNAIPRRPFPGGNINGLYPKEELQILSQRGSYRPLELLFY